MRILLVEDDAYLADSMLRALGKRGYKVTWKKNVKFAREALQEQDFDLAVLDYDLGLGGIGPDLLPDLDEKGVSAVLYSGLPRDVDIPQVSKGNPENLFEFLANYAEEFEKNAE